MKAKEKQCAFKSTLVCILFANKYIFKYHSDNFMSYNSLKDYPFGYVHSFPAIRSQDSEIVEVERVLKRDILFPSKDQGSVARRKGRAKHKSGNLHVSVVVNADWS